MIGHDLHKIQCVSSYFEGLPRVSLGQPFVEGLAGLGALGAALAHQLHAAAADGEGHGDLRKED